MASYAASRQLLCRMHGSEVAGKGKEALRMVLRRLDRHVTKPPLAALPVVNLTHHQSAVPAATQLQEAPHRTGMPLLARCATDVSSSGPLEATGTFRELLSDDRTVSERHARHRVRVSMAEHLAPVRVRCAQPSEGAPVATRGDGDIAGGTVVARRSKNQCNEARKDKEEETMLAKDLSHRTNTLLVAICIIGASRWGCIICEERLREREREDTNRKIHFLIPMSAADIEEEERGVRAELCMLAVLERESLFVFGVEDFAATEIQRWIRGYLARKRARLRKKRLQFTVLVLQRVTRGGFCRRNIKWLRYVIEQPERRALVMKYRYLQHGAIVVPRVAAALILQRFARRVPAILFVQHLRDLYQYVVRCAVKMQALARRSWARMKYGPILLERKLQRHERQLRAFVERQIAVRKLIRVERAEQEEAYERRVCQRMLWKGCSYAEASHDCRSTRNPPKASKAVVLPASPTGVHGHRATGAAASLTPTSLVHREAAFSAYCNQRHIADLSGHDTTDSDDDSIDEELLRPPRKPVRLVAAKRTKASESGSPSTPAHGTRTTNAATPPAKLDRRMSSFAWSKVDVAHDPSDTTVTGWSLRQYPGTPPPPVRKLSRAASALRLVRTPSALARHFNDEPAHSSGVHDVFSRLAHHWSQ